MTIEIGMFAADKGGSCIVHIIVKDELNTDEYKSKIIPQILTLLDNNQKISFLVELHKVGLWKNKTELVNATETGFAGCDIKQKLFRIAVAGDSIWQRVAVLAFSVFLPIKYFDQTKLKDAELWLQE